MIKSNLVIQTAFLGDLILSVPVLRRIKKIFPDDKLIVLCKKGLGDFLLKENIVDEVIEVEKSNSKSYSLALEDIKKHKINNIFCIHRSVRSLLLTSKIKAEKKVGFSSLLGFWIFEDLVPFRGQYPEVIRQFAILETTDPQTFEELNFKDFSYLNDSHLPQVPAFFSFHHKSHILPKQKKIAIFPGSVWATKQWTPQGFAQLTNLLIESNFTVDLLGGPTEKKLCETIAENTKGAGILAGSLTIDETIRSLSGYDLVVANDSAPTHMAVYNNIPVVTIFGPTTLKQGFRPWSDNSAVIENLELTCRPCGKHGHNECPLIHHNCMKSIRADEVFSQIKKMLGLN